MSDFKQIVGYIDQLHRDIWQLMVLAEKLIVDAGYVSLPTSGNRASWGMTSHIDRPYWWRARYLSRCYISEEEEGKFSESFLFLISLETNTIFDFPVVICARTIHPPLTEREIYGQVFLTDHFKTLATSRPTWHRFGEEDGWIVAEPTFKTPITKINAYILNLFEISDQQKVIDNIVTPLVEGGVLSEMLTLSTCLIHKDVL